jgi:hypothetical protein
MTNPKISDEEPVYTHIWGYSAGQFAVFAVTTSIPIDLFLTTWGVIARHHLIVRRVYQ